MKKQFANILTVGRMVISPIGAVFAWQEMPLVACVIFFVAALSDAVDGAIARHYDAVTPRGAALDPIADLVLYLSALLGLGVTGVWSWWVIGIMILGAAILWAIDKRAPSGPLKSFQERVHPAASVIALIAMLYTYMVQAIGDHTWVNVIFFLGAGLVISIKQAGRRHRGVA